MSRNLNRLTAAASRIAAKRDFDFVWEQLKEHNPPYTYPKKDSAQSIDRSTRSLIEWAGYKGIEIKLPDGWS